MSGYDVKQEVKDKYSLRGRVFHKLRDDILSGKYKEYEELKEVAIGEELGEKYGIKHLPNDFKKKGGFLRSTELSKEMGLYRQDYCGCVYSIRSESAAEM